MELEKTKSNEIIRYHKVIWCTKDSNFVDETGTSTQITQLSELLPFKPGVYIVTVEEQRS